MFTKYGDGKITDIVKTEDLTKKQKEIVEEKQLEKSDNKEDKKTQN